MAVRKLSTRHARFLLGRAATRVIPGLQAQMPFYDALLPMIEAGRPQIVNEVQLVQLDAAEAAFANLLPAVPPASIERSIALIALDNVTALGPTGAIIDEANQRVLTPRGRRDFVSYHDFRAVRSRVVKKPDAIYFNMLGAHRGHQHFFHFLFDRLPRLYYLLHRFELGREPLVVLTNADLPAFQRDIYRFIRLRFPNVRFEAMPSDERWQMQRLYHLDDFQPIKRTLADPAALDFCRSLVFDGFGLTPPKRRRRIYVTRSDTRRRRIGNEAEIVPIFERHGFEVVAPGKLSLREQVAMFMSAEAVAGPHGAGLTNIVFAPTDARVLEIFPANKIKNTYFLLAVSLGQTYRGVVGSIGQRHEWFNVAPAPMERALDGLMAAMPRGWPRLRQELAG